MGREVGVIIAFRGGKRLGVLGKMLLILGIFMVGFGVLLLFWGRIPYIGKLPGDIVIKKGNFVFYFPLATSILISVVLSLVFFLIGKLR